jgi:fatty-acid O-methyltransferase
MLYRLLEVTSRTRLRKRGVAVFYDALTRLFPWDDMTFMNYGFEPTGRDRLRLEPEDEPNRYEIQLYEHLSQGLDLAGKRVLEIGCGRGGGAAFVCRYHSPGSYVGVDIAGSAVDFCRRRHRGIPNLRFQQADAEDLPFDDESFDVILNVESSHAYLSIPRFLAEVTRLLRPSGTFVFCDVRPADTLRALEQELAACSLKLEHRALVTDNILRALELRSPRYREVLGQRVPWYLGKMMTDFAGVQGSRVHASFAAGTRQYLVCRMHKS